MDPLSIPELARERPCWIVRIQFPSVAPELLDHLVIGHDAYVSLRDRGVVFDRPGRPAA